MRRLAWRVLLAACKRGVAPRRTPPLWASFIASPEGSGWFAGLTR
jgi:hypothetical protein